MALTVMNNMMANSTLNELSRNNNKLFKSLGQVSSGMRINGAQDDASAYAISERMRVMMRGLGQDAKNAQMGTNLLKIAEGGIQEIINNLRNMRQLALDAANDHNTDADRETIQKSIHSYLNTINDIAATTNYNGKLLLNGNGGVSGTAGLTAATEPTGTPIRIANGDYTISSDGVYMMSTGYSGRITITASNVKIVQENAADVHYATAIECMSAGTNLWLDDVKINNGNDASTTGFFANDGKNKNVVKFHGSGNTLNIRNEVRLEAGNSSYDTRAANNLRETYAVVNIGGGLTVNGVGEGSSLRVSLADTGSGMNCRGASIGSDVGENLSSSDIVINSLSSLQAFSEHGAGIGAGKNSSVGNITIRDVGEIKVSSAEGVGIGAAGSASCGSIDIQAGKIYGSAFQTASVIGASTASGRCGSIDITADYMFLGTVNGVVSSDGTYTSSGYPGNRARTITSPATVNGQAFDPAGHSYIANPSLYTNAQIFECGDASGGPGAAALSGLVIHTGTRANQHVRIVINSMDTGTLGIQSLRVNSQQNAASALSALDDAIEYALGENTRMGAYQTRLAYAIENLVTANENVQASESTIRDADMAQAMLEYTKSNVLSQASQSMLAQANQNAGNVLFMLQ